MKSNEIQWKWIGSLPDEKNCNARELNQCDPDARLGEGLRFTVELGEHFSTEAPLQYLHVFWWHFSFHERQTRSLKERKQTRSLKERKQTRTFDTAEIGL